MILAIFGLILLVGSVIYKKKVDNSISIIWRMIFGLLIIMFLMLVSTIFLPGEEFAKETELVAFADSGVTSGSFFLGCGKIGESFYYVFYEKKEAGIQYGKIYAEDPSVYIIEKDRDGGVIRRFHKRPSLTKTIKLLFFPFASMVSGTETRGKTEIVIPTGSIKRLFSLDLK